jgi:CubicO group peptidase (beta-lactamase class C family)
MAQQQIDKNRVVDPSTIGVDRARLLQIPAAIASDVERELYDGAVIIVARHGQIVLHEAIGYSNRAEKRATRTDDIFAIMSVTKSMSAALVLSRFERGEIMLTTPVAEVIPEFGARGKKRITIAQLLGHTGGFGGAVSVPFKTLVNLKEAVAALCAMAPAATPGENVSYSPFVAHSILAEVVRRLDGGKRSYREIITQEIFEPLGMHDTSLGQRRDRETRQVPIVVRDRREARFSPELLESLNELLVEGSEMPAAGGYATAYDCFRFAEMLSPLTIELATRNFTGLKPNLDSRTFAREVRGWPEWPAYLGLGFYLRGEGIFPCYHGSLASPGTYGHAGAGSTLFWVDPVADMTFVGLTAGLMEESYSIERWQRLSDMALSAITDRATNA